MNFFSWALIAFKAMFVDPAVHDRFAKKRKNLFARSLESELLRNA